MKKKVILSILFMMLINGCSGIKEELSSKKKKSVNEFLIEKKNPLVLPPDFDTLPKPKNKNIQHSNKNNDLDLNSILDSDNNNDTSNLPQSNELEESISNILKNK